MRENWVKANQFSNGHLKFEFYSIKALPASSNFKWQTLKETNSMKINVRASKKHQFLSFSSYSVYLMNIQTDSNFSIFDSPLIAFFHPESKLVSYHNIFWRFICFTILDVLYYINAKKNFSIFHTISKFKSYGNIFYFNILIF